jgi:hypothetical protein
MLFFKILIHLIGTGIDIVTDFDAAEGDTKTTDCENF